MNTRILGQAATAAGAFGAACMAAVLVMIFQMHPGTDNPLVVALAVFGAVAFLLMMVFVALYVYYDAESRGMKGGLWALLIFLFASLPGFLIYLLMRGPRLRACPVCRTTLQSDFVVCPTCQTKVGHGCPGCHRHIEPAWTVCPWCQAELAAARRMIRPV